MAIQPIQILTPRVQAPGDFLGGASNILSAQLNNAVRVASQMTDLQASQEGDFLQERERLYLNRERRGLETRRRMESDRAFAQDERQFSAQLGMQNRQLALDELRVKSGIENAEARLGLAEQELGLAESRMGLEEQMMESEERRAKLRHEAERQRLGIQLSSNIYDQAASSMRIAAQNKTLAEAEQAEAEAANRVAATAYTIQNSLPDNFVERPGSGLNPNIFGEKSLRALAQDPAYDMATRNEAARLLGEMIPARGGVGDGAGNPSQIDVPDNGGRPRQ